MADELDIKGADQGTLLRKLAVLRVTPALEKIDPKEKKTPSALPYVTGEIARNLRPYLLRISRNPSDQRSVWGDPSIKAVKDSAGKYTVLEIKYDCPSDDKIKEMLVKEPNKAPTWMVQTPDEEDLAKLSEEGMEFDEAKRVMGVTVPHRNMAPQIYMWSDAFLLARIITDLSDMTKEVYKK